MVGGKNNEFKADASGVIDMHPLLVESVRRLTVSFLKGRLRWDNVRWVRTRSWTGAQEIYHHTYCLVPNFTNHRNSPSSRPPPLNDHADPLLNEKTPGAAYPKKE